MRYVTIISIVLAVILAVSACFLNERLIASQKKLALSEAKKTALETEVKKHNEKSLQASKQIEQLRKQIQAHKDDSSDGYRCLSVSIPDDVVKLLHHEKN